MARKITLGQIGDYAEDQFNKLLKAAVLVGDKALKQNSPVLTGRFRASWAIGQNAAPYQGHPVVPKGSVVPEPAPNAVNYQLGQEKAGNVYSLHNNLIYAEAIAYGTNLPPSWNGEYKVKKKWGLDPGWVDLIAKDLGVYIKLEAARIGKSS